MRIAARQPRKVPTVDVDPVGGASLEAAVRDGAWYSVMVGTGDQYLTAFGISLGATTLQIGLLSALPTLAGAIFQGLGVHLMERFSSRRAFIIAGVILQALTWFPIALLPILLGTGATTASLLIGLVVVYQITGNVIGPAWNSLIGDLIPADARGRFFGWRSQVNGCCTFGSMLVSGGLLHLCQKIHIGMTGFLTLFLVAGVARLRSAFWVARYDDPPYYCARKHRFSFFQFLRKAPRSNFARFVLFVSVINFAATFGGPYYAVYMLRDLGLSYLEFTAITAALTLSQSMATKYWGRLSDRLGSKRVLTLCGWGICVTPLLWLVSPKSVYLVIIQIFTGLVWAGFNLATTSFLFDAATPPKRARCAAYQTIISSTFGVLGSLAGGLVAATLPVVWEIAGFRLQLVSSLLPVFFLSSVIRFAAMIYLLPLFAEAREVMSLRRPVSISRIAQSFPEGLPEPG